MIMDEKRRDVIENTREMEDPMKADPGFGKLQNDMTVARITGDQIGELDTLTHIGDAFLDLNPNII